jgi:hypothetical protein
MCGKVPDSHAVFIRGRLRKRKIKYGNAQGFDENKEAARKGGRAAGKALGAYEEESGKKVVSSSNFKGQIADAKKKALGSGKKKKKDE